MVLLGFNAVNHGQSQEGIHGGSHHPNLHTGESAHVQKSFPTVWGAQVGPEDRHAVRSYSGHENHGHLTGGEGQNHQRDLEIAYLIVSVPGSFKHREARGKIPPVWSRKRSHRALWKVKLRHCPVAPVSRVDVNEHWKLSQSHGVNHGSGTQTIARISLFVPEACLLTHSLHFQWLCHSVPFSPSHTHT